MPLANSRDGVRIYYEATGPQNTADRLPVLFLHEYAGDYRSWAGQAAALGETRRCLVASARGYPGSDIPLRPDQYSQELAIADALSVLDAAGVAQAHVVGHSMGGYTALRLGLQHRSRVRSIVASGAGSGSDPASRGQFLADCEDAARRMEVDGRIPAQAMARGATRIQLERKDARAYQRFITDFAEHDAHAAALTLRGVQAGRPSLFDYSAELTGLAVPVLLLVGDEDEACLDINLALKRIMPAAELMVFPRSGHMLNLEEPHLFNLAVRRFIDTVDEDRWAPRHLLAQAASSSALSFNE